MLLAIEGMLADKAHIRPFSQAVLVWLWLQEVGAGQRGWRGWLQPSPEGKVRYCRDWTTLVALLEALRPTTSSRKEHISEVDLNA